MALSETTPTARSCWQCALVPVCKYADKIGEFGGFVKPNNIRVMALMIAGDCPLFRECK
jgi:hypothetical protein